MASVTKQVTEDLESVVVGKGQRGQDHRRTQNILQYNSKAAADKDKFIVNYCITLYDSVRRYIFKTVLDCTLL